MFLSRNKKNNVYPCKPQFYCVKVGFKGVKIIKVCFRNEKIFIGYRKGSDQIMQLCLFIWIFTVRICPEDTFSHGELIHFAFVLFSHRSNFCSVFFPWRAHSFCFCLVFSQVKFLFCLFPMASSFTLLLSCFLTGKILVLSFSHVELIHFAFVLFSHRYNSCSVFSPWRAHSLCFCLVFSQVKFLFCLFPMASSFTLLLSCFLTGKIFVLSFSHGELIHFVFVMFSHK